MLYVLQITLVLSLYIDEVLTLSSRLFEDIPNTLANLVLYIFCRRGNKFAMILCSFTLSLLLIGNLQFSSIRRYFNYVYNKDVNSWKCSLFLSQAKSMPNHLKFSLMTDGQFGIWLPWCIHTSVNIRWKGNIQYIPKNMHTVLLCFALLWLCNRS